MQKQSEAQGCVIDGTQGPITKDEEEVAEALYALAGVFSSVGKTDKARSAGQELGANSSNLTKAESLVTPIDGLFPSFCFCIQHCLLYVFLRLFK